MANSRALWPWLIGSLALTSLVSAAGGALTADSVRTWYPTLIKPDWTPPDLVFPIVWPVLYVLMAIAAFLVFRAAGGLRAASSALIAYGVQLALNLAWSWLFFGLHNPFAAGIEILVLFGAILLTTALFWNYSRTAALLLVPYLAWTGFASVLNWRIIALNP